MLYYTAASKPHTEQTVPCMEYLKGFGSHLLLLQLAVNLVLRPPGSKSMALGGESEEDSARRPNCSERSPFADLPPSVMLLVPGGRFIASWRSNT